MSTTSYYYIRPIWKISNAYIYRRGGRMASIEALIQAVGASVLYLSPFSQDFNPIEHWW